VSPLKTTQLVRVLAVDVVAHPHAAELGAAAKDAADG
jgi:hypothetical protein